ncbi:MAG TPA: hypothetical protein VJJ82_05445 [Candidatus Nanoarchaeia archaeon]|nr:hypothetical protein [Candidatus Nanoarchaeia archaeon]
MAAFSQRLAARAQHLIERAEQEPNLKSTKTLRAIANELKTLKNGQKGYDRLIQMPEVIHAANHQLCEELHKKTRA